MVWEESVVWEERVWYGRRECGVGGENVVWEERVWCGRRESGLEMRPARDEL